jgi:hypothetical protein
VGRITFEVLRSVPLAPLALGYADYSPPKHERERERVEEAFARNVGDEAAANRPSATVRHAGVLGE